MLNDGICKLIHCILRKNPHKVNILEPLKLDWKKNFFAKDNQVIVSLLQNLRVNTGDSQ